MKTCKTEKQRGGGGTKTHATINEFKTALGQLTKTDHAKLKLIAEVFWHHRIEPIVGSQYTSEDLLIDAVMDTLEGSRHWPKEVPLIKFLDRTMESISSHFAERQKARATHVSIGDGLSEDQVSEHSQVQTMAPENPVVEELVERENRELLGKYFPGDPEAVQVLNLRAEGHSAEESRGILGWSGKQWDTVRRRIDRRFVRLIKEQKREDV